MKYNEWHFMRNGAGIHLDTFVPVAPPRRLHDLSERRRAASLIDGEATEVHDGRKGNSGGGGGGGILRL